MLILTARDTVTDKTKGLDTGGGDYLVMPFDLNELLARLRALLRRSQGKAAPVIHHGGTTLDPAAHSVTLDGRPGTHGLCVTVKFPTSGHARV